MKEDPPLDAKCRDKFLVQSVAVTADRELSNVAAIVSLAYPMVNGAMYLTKRTVAACRKDVQRLD